MSFPIIEELRSKIRTDKVGVATKAEVDRVSDILSEAFNVTALEGFQPDDESRALDELFRSERLSLASVARYYHLYITLKYRPAAD